MAGMIAEVLSTTRVTRQGAEIVDIKADPNGGDVGTSEQYLSPGEDSLPLPGDSIATMPVQGSGRTVAVGFVDPVNTGVAADGEVRRYSRDSDGVIQATFHIKGDGSIEVTSVAGGSSLVIGADGSIAGTNPGGSFSLEPSGSFEASNGSGNFALQANGDFVVNGAIISAAGEITNAAGKVLGTHLHGGSATAPVGAVSPTGPPV